jgi:uncharacterized membrane protein
MFFSLVGRIVASGMLIWALDNHPYGYFTLMRIVVCLVASYCAVLAYEQEKLPWVYILGGVAVLFNPIIPFHMTRESWKVVDIAMAVVLLVSFFFVKGEKKVKASDGTRRRGETDENSEK